jgi:hypothetical protein
LRTHFSIASAKRPIQPTRCVIERLDRSVDHAHHAHKAMDLIRPVSMLHSNTGLSQRLGIGTSFVAQWVEACRDDGCRGSLSRSFWRGGEAAGSDAMAGSERYCCQYHFIMGRVSK